MTRLRLIIGATAALCLSGVLHAGVALMIAPQDVAVQTEGGGIAEVAALGAAFADFFAGSTPVAPSAQTAVQSASQSAVIPATAIADVALAVTQSVRPEIANLTMTVPRAVACWRRKRVIWRKTSPG